MNRDSLLGGFIADCYSFADLRQHLTLSILAHFQNGDQQKPPNTDDERVQISASEAFANSHNVEFCGNFVTLSMMYFRHSYKLHTSQEQPSTRTHGRVYYGCSRPGLQPTRAAPSIIYKTQQNVKV